MKTRPKRTNNVEAGSPAWVERLGKAIAAIGEKNFPQTLVDALGSLTDFDYAVVFAYHQSEKPLCLFHTFSPQDRVIFVDDYLKGPYLLDPFFKACGRRIESGLYRLREIAPDRFYQSEYYRSYYMNTGLSEEMCYTFCLPKGVAVVISLMRSGESSKFSARQFKVLNSATPIVVSLARRHWHDILKQFDIPNTDKQPRRNRLMTDNTVREFSSKRITPRESQVIAQVLEGHSSDSIAKNLGISVGTVRIHRRNIYAKLHISSQQELFSIFFEKIAAGQ